MKIENEDSARDRLARQMAFAIEIDKLKTIDRVSLISDRSRRENSAEHSWHFALLALLLSEHADQPGLDLLKVVRLALVHDIVEIDAGDTYIYDEEAKRGQAAREAKAADRLFGLLPADQAAEYRALWDEFEAAATPEAIYARSIDRLQPLMLNLAADSQAWRERGISASQVRDINSYIANGSQSLWQWADAQVAAAQKSGKL